jgi:ketosteroid isomerase-like protein
VDLAERRGPAQHRAHEYPAKNVARCRRGDCVDRLEDERRGFRSRDTALVAGLVRLSWTLKGEHHSRLLRIAHVWTKAAGRWRLAYTQLTRVP